MKPPPPDADGRYPIRVVTRLTGLTAHTLRVWERRHAAVSPERTGGNSRRYSAAEVERLIRLRAATQLGYPIRDLVALDDAALEALAAGREGAGPPPRPSARDGSDLEPLRTEYLRAVGALDARGAAALLARTALLLPPTRFVFDVVLPVLRETGERWAAGGFTVVHEHLVTAQVRGLVDTLLRLLPQLPGAPRLLVATPDGHGHEFGALAGALLAAARGFEPLYLGASVPAADLLAAAASAHVDLLLLGVLHPTEPSALDVLQRDLGHLVRKVEVWVGLPPGHPASGRVKQVRYFERFEDLDLALVQRASGAR
jgi:DNA-binding transcriptional MerR regulator